MAEKAKAEVARVAEARAVEAMAAVATEAVATAVVMVVEAPHLRQRSTSGIGCSEPRPQRGIGGAGPLLLRAEGSLAPPVAVS